MHQWVTQTIRFGQTFAYDLDQGTRHIIWNVEAAIHIAARRPRKRFVFDDMIGVMQSNGEMPDALCEEKFDAADITIPVILVPNPTVRENHAIVMIDGWHRLAKAIAMEVPFITAALLTADDERAIRLKDVIYLETPCTAAPKGASSRQQHKTQ